MTEEKQEGNWAYDKQEGTWTFYYETGEVSAKVDFHNDQQGHTVFFYRNGNIRQDGQIENGLAQGLVKHYYEDGQLKEESQWMKNKRHGTTIYFDSLTHKGDTILYDNGTLIKK